MRKNLGVDVTIDSPRYTELSSGDGGNGNHTVATILMLEKGLVLAQFERPLPLLLNDGKQLH